MNLKFLSWQEGKYSDLWFFVHLFSGIAGGTLLLILGVAEAYAWMICGVLAVTWEIGEWKYKIPESLRNRILDIATAFLGGFIGYIYLRSLNYRPFVNLTIFLAEAAILSCLSVIGWKKYRIKRV
jgi:hypothetical protein